MKYINQIFTQIFFIQNPNISNRKQNIKSIIVISGIFQISEQYYYFIHNFFTYEAIFIIKKMFW